MKSIVNYFMIGFLMLAIASAATACSGATGDVGPNVDESNAAAKAAVSYESGAGFVEALAQAGVPCTNQTVTPYTVPTAQGPIHVADTVSCNYADDDWITGFVAWPSEESSTYFKMYYESSQKAKADVGAQSLTLKGDLWFATAPAEQRLFITQQAIGGQLIKPGL